MDPNSYLNFQYDDNNFFVVKTEKKEPTTSALKTLKNIEAVMRLNLTYRPGMDDEFSKLPQNLLRAKLKDVAKEIKTQFHKKASHASFFARFFGGISRQEKAIQAVYDRIENLESPPTFDLPNDAIKNILGHLDLKDIASVKQVSKTSDELSKEVEINRARDYGFQGNDYKEAKQYLLNLYQGIKSYSNNSEKNRGIFVMKGKWYSKRLDVEATLKNIKALPPAAKNDVVNELKKILDDPFSSVQSVKNNCALLNMFAVKLDDHLLKRFEALNADPKIIKAFLDNGADVNASDKKGMTALLYAARRHNNPEMIKLLLDSGADVNASNKDGWTPLMIVVRNHLNTEMIKLLLVSGADVNASNKDGWTPLMFAVSQFHSYKDIYKLPEMIKLLLDKGADVNASKQDGTSPLLVALKYNTHSEKIKQLLDNGADVNARDQDGMTPLLYSLKYNLNREIIELLVKNGARTDVVDENGNTAFDLLFKYFKKT